MVLRECDGVEREQDLESVGLAPGVILLLRESMSFGVVVVALEGGSPSNLLCLHIPNANKHTACFAGLQMI